MNRGYIKFWRKAQDSVSWTRGLLYQGLLINILTRAAWKPRYEWGIQVQPGEFLVKVVAWANTLGVSESSVRRMLKNLVEDDFISVTNVANRYTRITVVNWHIYQQEENPSRRTDGGRMTEQAEDQRRTDGGPSYKEEEGKKERNLNTHPLTPSQARGEDDAASPSRSGNREEGTSHRKSRASPAYSADFEAFWQAYPRKIGKDAAYKVWKRKRHELPPPEELAAILARQCHCEQWQRDGGQYIPHPATWLNQGRWQDEIEGQTGTVMDYPEGW